MAILASSALFLDEIKTYTCQWSDIYSQMLLMCDPIDYGYGHYKNIVADYLSSADTLGTLLIRFFCFIIIENTYSVIKLQNKTVNNHVDTPVLFFFHGDAIF